MPLEDQKNPATWFDEIPWETDDNRSSGKSSCDLRQSLCRGKDIFTILSWRRTRHVKIGRETVEDRKSKGKNSDLDSGSCSVFKLPGTLHQTTFPRISSAPSVAIGLRKSCGPEENQWAWATQYCLLLNSETELKWEVSLNNPGNCQRNQTVWRLKLILGHVWRYANDFYV